MTTTNFEKVRNRLKLSALALILGSLMLGQVSTLDANSSDALLNSIMKHQSNHHGHHSSQHHKNKTINIGYPKGKGPVPLTLDCLAAQLVTGRTTTLFARSSVEPTIAVNPKDPNHIVVAWQQGRFNNGSSLEIGIAYSKDGGEHFKRTTVPLQVCEGGINQRVSDVWLSYSNDGKTLYLQALAINRNLDINTQNQSVVVVTTSKDDGKEWSAPIPLFSSLYYTNEPTGIYPIPDKNAVTADPNIKKNAYGVYDVFADAFTSHSDTYFNKTTDRGETWSPNKIIYNPFPDLVNTGLSNGIFNDNQTIDNVIVVQPKHHHSDPKTNGDLLNFMVRIFAAPGATDNDYLNDSFPYQFTNYDIALVRSSDEGENFTTAATIVTPFVDAQVYTGGYTYSGGNITGGVGTLLRTGDVIPSYAVNPKNGNLYVAYQTGEFTASGLPLIGLRASYDGGYTWSESALVSRTPLDAPNPQAFTPFVAVTEDGYVGILYHDFRNDPTSNSDETLTDAWFAIYRETSHSGSTGIGLDFEREVRVSKHSYIAQNGPKTSQGVMTNGDYNFAVAQEDTFYTTFIMSKKGPFAPPTEIINDPITNSILLLDNNYRTAPFFRAVKQKK